MTARYMSGWRAPDRPLESHRRCTGQYAGTECTCQCGHRPALRLADAPAAAGTGPRCGSLCSGYGGLDISVLEVLGGTVAWHADTDPAAAKVLDHRWPGVPNHGDITSIDWATVEPVDVLTAGWPCQPWSTAGQKKGADDERAIWPAVARAVRVLRPGLVFLENVPAIAAAGELARAVADLAAVGYVGSWCCVRASAVGAPHQRERLFIAARPADADGPRRPALPLGTAAAGRPERNDAGRGGLPLAADAHRDRLPGWSTGGAGEADKWRQGPWTAVAGHRAAVADPASDGFLRDPGSAGSGPARGSGERLPGGSPGRSPVERWGRWSPAIQRWERLTRPAPDAVEHGARGNRRLNPAFSEWMMGLPAGWVTAVPGLSRNDQLRLIGNGVAPQQGAAALRWLLAESLGAAA